MSNRLKAGAVTTALLFLICILCLMSVLVSHEGSSELYATAQAVNTQNITTSAPAAASAEPPAEEAATGSPSQALQYSSAFRDDSISAPYAGLYEASSFSALYEKEARTAIPPASLAKVLTAITALTYVPSDTVFTVGSEQELVPARSSLCLIKEGHRLTLYQLLTGMLIASGNDAAYTVAVNTARFVMERDGVSDKEALAYFTELMNCIAKNIGAQDSLFKNPDGFDCDGQYVTVRDLALIGRYAMSFEEIREIVACAEKYTVFTSGENVTWKNSNQLLHSDSPYYFPEANGMKTGTTALAGKCLMATAQIKGKTYIAVVAGCTTEDSRYKSAADLLRTAYSM